MRWAFAIIVLLVLSGFVYGRVKYNDYWQDAHISFIPAYKPAHGSGGPELTAFPAGSQSQSYLFDDSSDECILSTMQLGHDYKEGTAIKCHVHWSPITTSTNNVNWQVDYFVAGTGQVIGASQMLDISTPGAGVAYQHQMAELADIACTSCNISTLISARVCRDADGTNGTDNMVGDVAGMYFDCHYQIDSPGSWTYNTK